MSEPVKKSLSIFVYFILVAATVTVFWQVHNFHFTNYDDDQYVTNNQHVLTGLTSENIIWAFTSGYSANWHPLTWLSLMLDCQLFGTDAGRMHLVNLLLHVINVLLLFTVLKKMTGSLWPSAFVATAFALHPMHVESVAWVAERKDVLSTLFWLLTMAAYLGYAKRPSMFRYILTLLIFAIGLMAKPMLVTLPFVLLLLDYWPLNRFETKITKVSGRRQSNKSASVSSKRTVLYRLIIEKIPFISAAVVSSVITFFVQRKIGVVPDINTFSLTGRISNVFLSYAKYIFKIFWPQNLAAFYPFDSGSIILWQVVLCAAGLFIISVLVLRFGRGRKYLPVGWFWFVGTLVPVIGIVQAGEQSMADRYTYIPYAGLFIIIAWGLPEILSKWPYGKQLLATSAVIVLTALGICAYRQASYWENSSMLFSHALETTRNNYIAYFNLGNDLLKQGKPAAAIENLNKALQIVPQYMDAILAIGCAYADQGNLAQAFKYFQKTIELKPASAHAAYAHDNIGTALQKQGKAAEAIWHYEQAVRIMPDFAKAHYDIANALVSQGRYDEAAEHFRAAIRLAPGSIEPMNNLALLMATHPQLKNRDANEAVRLATRACQLSNYSNPAAMGTLAAAYAASGRFTEAIETSKRAINLAEATKQPQVKNLLEYYLTFYAEGKPYVATSPRISK